MTDDELEQLAELMNRAHGLMVATFDREDDPFHPVQWVKVSANPDRRIINLAGARSGIGSGLAADEFR